MITARQEWEDFDPYEKWRSSWNGTDCLLCLEDTKGKRHTETTWTGPLKDVRVCLTCDMLPLAAA